MQKIITGYFTTGMTAFGITLIIIVLIIVLSKKHARINIRRGTIELNIPDSQAEKKKNPVRRQFQKEEERTNRIGY